MSKQSKRKPHFFIHMRFRKGDPEHNLLAATQHFVKARGGSVAMIGPIEIQEWSDEFGKFHIAIKCLGRRPENPERKP